MIRFLLILRSTFTCPLHWHDEGVRPSGWTTCRPNPVGDDYRDARTGLIHDRSIQPDGQISGRVFCLPGQEPRVLSDRMISCVLRSR